MKVVGCVCGRLKLRKGRAMINSQDATPVIGLWAVLDVLVWDLHSRRVRAIRDLRNRPERDNNVEQFRIAETPMSARRFSGVTRGHRRWRGPVRSKGRPSGTTSQPLLAKPGDRPRLMRSAHINQIAVRTRCLPRCRYRNRYKRSVVNARSSKSQLATTVLA
jgi:hypothetical protein